MFKRLVSIVVVVMSIFNMTFTTVYAEENIEVDNTTRYEYYENWLWVGDSRIVGMSGNVGMEYLAKSAMGLDWYLENQEIVYEKRNYNVVFCLGINDYWRIYDYINVYNNMPDEFTQNNKIFIMSINPVDEKRVSYLHNYNYEYFNDLLKNNIRNDYYYMDCYTYLQDTYFNAPDGIHYDGYTNVKIYNFIIDTVTGSKHDSDLVMYRMNNQFKLINSNYIKNIMRRAI